MGGMLIYVFEIIKYDLSYRLFYDKKLKRTWLPVVLGIVYFVLFGMIFPEFDSSGKNALAYGGAWVAVFFLLKERQENRGAVFFVMLLTALGLEQIVSIPLRIVGLFVGLETWLGDYDSLLLSFFALIVMFTACVWKTKKKHILKWSLSNRTINFLIAFMVIGMLVTVTCVDYAEEYVSNFRFSVLTIILCAISYVSVGILGVFIIHIRNVNEKMDGMLQNEIVLKDMQKSYYEALLKKEEETRSYRHDMVGHLLCLENFAKEGKTEALEKYLSKMQQQIRQIQGNGYVTGNQVIDVITNHFLSGVDKETEVQVSGFVGETLEIDNVSLCSIYTNLLKNAIEELTRINAGTKLLKVEFMQGTQFLSIEIRNSLSGDSAKKSNLLETEKEDKRNHGIGLKNVKRTVKEYGGEFETRIEKDVFIARVILKWKK